MTLRTTAPPGPVIVTLQLQLTTYPGDDLIKVVATKNFDLSVGYEAHNKALEKWVMGLCNNDGLPLSAGEHCQYRLCNHESPDFVDDQTQNQRR